MTRQLPIHNFCRPALVAAIGLFVTGDSLLAEPGEFKVFSAPSENKIVSQRNFTNERGQKLTEKFEIYSLPSPNGTKACRTTTDERGRPIQWIFYGGFSSSPKDESDFFPTSIQLFCHDDARRKTWVGIYTPEWLLQSSYTTSYGASGQKE